MPSLPYYSHVIEPALCITNPAYLTIPSLNVVCNQTSKMIGKVERYLQPLILLLLL